MSYNGRDYILKISGTALAGVTVVNSDYLREVLDATSGDMNGWQKFHGEPGRRGLNLSVEGIASSTNFTVIKTAYDANTNTAATLDAPNGKTVSAADGFAMSALSFTGAEKDLVKFSMTLSSSGEVTEATTV